jgi:amidohydrolase
LISKFEGASSGPNILVRCELDGLPISESIEISHGSKNKGISHKCGHDGHMAILAGLALRLKTSKPESGSVSLLFQPAEETGQGARLVLDDNKFKQFEPDIVLALHNLPGYEMGCVILKDNIFASASTGVRINLEGKTSHAGEPEEGNSPALAVAQLIQVLSSIPQFHTSLYQAAKVTIINARIGEVAFGTSPGEGDVMATLRAYSQDILDRLLKKTTEIATKTAETFNLKVKIDSMEPFPATINDPDIVSVIEKSAQEIDLETYKKEVPFAWSEDFGHFTSEFRGALIGVGAGNNHPALHHPDYDFPDELIEPSINLLETSIRRLQEI